MKDEKPIVISLGGSLIVPDEIATDFLSYFRDVIEKQVKRGKRFAIVTGGGRVARKYIQAAQDIREDLTDEDLDWIGIYATRMNAHFLHHLLKDVATYDIVTDPIDAEMQDEPVLIGAGWKPGASSDHPAVAVAEAVGADTVINLSNVDAVYRDDPMENPSAEKFDSLSWDEYLKLIPKTWSPGLSTPFDPIAARRAQESGLQVIIMGSDLSQLENYFAGEDFEGTVIS